MSTGIEWTDETWNPTTGCDRVSPGCDNCYALTLAARLKTMGSAAYQQDGDPRTSGPGFALQMHPDRLDQPLRWTRPRRVFVNSMSDLFHPKVTDEFIAQVFAVMALAEGHTFQVLTKRPKRMRSLVGDYGRRTLPDGRPFVFRQAVKQAAWTMTCERGEPDSPARYLGYDAWFEGNWPLRNVWLGTSVEDQQRADERIPALLETPAAVRFLSCEPLLGPVALRGSWHDWIQGWTVEPDHDPTCDGYCSAGCPIPVQVETPGRIDWVIVGGESGPNARPMHPAWARDLRDQCVDSGAAFFFKQWGAWAPDTDFEIAGPHTIVPEHGENRAFTAGWGMTRVGKHAAGRELDGRTWDEYPQQAVAS